MIKLNYFYILLSILLPFIIHELGHELTARYYKYKITWHLIFYKGLIPRLIYYYPKEIDKKIKKRISLSGFIFEFIGAILLLLYMIYSNKCHSYICIILITTCLHRILYPYYAGEHNDFNY